MKAAPRYIPVTLDDLTGWSGPVIEPYTDESGAIRYARLVVVSVDHGGRVHLVNEDMDYVVRRVGALLFDGTVAAIRDHLIRRYALPQWHRDTPGGLTPEQSAAVVLGSVSRVRAGMGQILGARAPWKLHSEEGAYRTWDCPIVAGACPAVQMLEPDTRFRPGGWLVRDVARGPETGDAGSVTQRKCQKCGSARLLLRSIGSTVWTFRQREDGVFERDDVTEPEVHEDGNRLECLDCENEWPIGWRTNAKIERARSS